LAAGDVFNVFGKNAKAASDIDVDVFWFKVEEFGSEEVFE
jgi:hypothetical protein